LFILRNKAEKHCKEREKEKWLNEQVKRNVERFTLQFRFQLTDAEKNELVANCDQFVLLKYSSSNSYVFTEQGVAMLSKYKRNAGHFGLRRVKYGRHFFVDITHLEKAQKP
jgi:hypothetical protein